MKLHNQFNGWIDWEIKMIHYLLRARSRISDNLCYRSLSILYCTGHALRILPCSLCTPVGPWAVTYCGLSHCRVLYFTPVPQVREQEPNLLHAPQCPSCFRMSGVSQMQWPLKQCWKRESDVRMIRWLTYIRWEDVVQHITIFVTSSWFFPPLQQKVEGLAVRLCPWSQIHSDFINLHVHYAHVCMQVSSPASSLNCSLCYISSSPVCSRDVI